MTGGMTPQDVPPGFLPASSRRQRPGKAAAAGEVTPPSYTPHAGESHSRHARSGQPSEASSAAQSAPSPAPATYVPRGQRRAAGSTRVANPAAPASPGKTVTSPAPLRGVRNSAGLPSPTPGAQGVAAPPTKRRRAVKILAAFLAALLIALIVGVFGAWNWVNGKLVKEDWLTGSTASPGTSWLLLGSDERDGTAGGSPEEITGYRTDTILVLTKPKSGPSSLISIPRDSLTEVDGKHMKINAVAQLAGPKALVGEVEQITGRRIDHVAKIKFGGLQQVVDALGGVELCYDQDISDSYSQLNWQAGCHVADGTTALAFARMRYADPNGDFGRAERQRQVIAAIVKKGASAATLTNPAKVAKVADATLGAVSVDEKTNPWTLLQMALAFRSASGEEGVTGSVYWTNPDYRVSGVGSSVLLDDKRNLELFAELGQGSHSPGTVGTLAESR